MAEVKVCKVADLKDGEGKTFNVKSKQIALFKKENQFYAIDNTCIHMGGNLGDGDLDGEEVICPLHMWRFNIKTGENTQPGSGKVNSYKVKVKGSDVLIEL